MAQFFLSSSGDYFETMTEVSPPIGADDDTGQPIARPWPDGRIAVPQRPAPHWIWQDGAWDEGAVPDPKPALRAQAVLSRQAFCLALFRAEVLAEADAIAAARGDWPAALEGMLADLAPAAAAEARIVWATSSEVHRSHPLLALIAGHMEIDEAGLDEIFGLVAQEQSK